MQASRRASIFERYPKTTLFSLIAVLFFFTLALAEYCAGLLGLGKVVLYEAHPVYGYRPKPDQTVARTPQYPIHTNNLGLRAQTDWDLNDFQNKVLFLGDSVTYGGSYIANQALFSHLAVQNSPELISGNGGVNGWGVNNVHAFIQDMQFLPAQIYVSVFPEGDFYRGLQRIGGQPFWTRQPRFALEELLQYFVYIVHLKKIPITQYYSLDDKSKTQIAELAVKNLQSLDDYLKAQHRTHLIYITPSRSQIEGTDTEDKIIKSLLDKYHLNVIYLKDRIMPLAAQEKTNLFHDSIHLSEKGHVVWAKCIASDLANIKNNENTV